MAGKILGPDGKPIKREALTEEHARPSLTGVRSILAEHPATGLTPQRAARLLRQAEQGDASAYLALAEDMEERDLHYLSVLGTRKRAVTQLEITVEAAGDDAASVRAADLVREWLRRETLQGELFNILDAVGKGVSAVEIMWDLTPTRSWPAQLIWRDPRWFEFDREAGQRLMLREMPEPVELPLFKYIVHRSSAKSGLPIRGGVARAAVWSYLFKNYTAKDWAVFCEVYGQPLRIGKYDGSASPADLDVLALALRNLGSDAAAMIPRDMLIEFVEAQRQAAGDMYERRCDWLDRQVSKAVLGQTMTTEVKGGSLAAAKVHESVRHDIVDADAGELAATLNRDLIRPLVMLNLGPQDAYPRLLIKRPEVEDLTGWTKAVAELVDRGLEIEQSGVRDRLGLPEPAEGAKLLHPANIGAAPSRPAELPPAPHRTARQAAELGQGDALDDLAADALADWEPLVAPLLAPIEAALDEAADLEAFRDRLAELAQQMDPAALVDNLAQALFVARLGGALGAPASDEEADLA